MKRYLLLENGSRFEGEGFGAECPKEGVICEVVFTSAFFVPVVEVSIEGF